MSSVEVTRVRVTAREFNDARRALLLLTAKHASFTPLADVRLPAGDDPLSQGALEGRMAQRQAPRLWRAQGLHAPEHFSRAAVILCVF